MKKKTKNDERRSERTQKKMEYISVVCFLSFSNAPRTRCRLPVVCVCTPMPLTTTTSARAARALRSCSLCRTRARARAGTNSLRVAECRVPVCAPVCASVCGENVVSGRIFVRAPQLACASVCVCASGACQCVRVRTKAFVKQPHYVRPARVPLATRRPNKLNFI